jgi:type II secretion system protein C
MIQIVLAVATISALPSDIVLSGLVLTRDEKAGAAILRSAGKTRVAGVGESAFGGQVTAIDAKGVMLLFGEDRLRLHLTKGSSLRRSVPAPSSPVASPEVVGSAPPPTASNLTLSRADVDRRLSIELDRILAETALVPVTDEGRIVGVALRRIAQGSLLTEVGLQPGDVITELNGTAIDGIATLMSLYSRLQTASELHAVVLREGRPVSLGLKLR